VLDDKLLRAQISEEDKLRVSDSALPSAASTFSARPLPPWSHPPPRRCRRSELCFVPLGASSRQADVANFLLTVFAVVFLQPLHEQITKLQEELAAERLSREVMDERKTKEIKSVESSISLDLTVEKRARKDLESKIMKQVDETCFALRLDLAREKKLREEAEERHEKEVADEIIRIADAIDQERKNRLDGEEAILRKLNDEVAALTEQITQEQVTSPRCDLAPCGSGGAGQLDSTHRAGGYTGFRTDVVPWPSLSLLGC